MVNKHKHTKASKWSSEEKESTIRITRHTSHNMAAKTARNNAALKMTRKSMERAPVCMVKHLSKSRPVAVKLKPTYNVQTRRSSRLKAINASANKVDGNKTRVKSKITCEASDLIIIDDDSTTGESLEKLPIEPRDAVPMTHSKDVPQASCESSGASSNREQNDNDVDSEMVDTRSDTIHSLDSIRSGEVLKIMNKIRTNNLMGNRNVPAPQPIVISSSANSDKTESERDLPLHIDLSGSSSLQSRESSTRVITVSDEQSKDSSVDNEMHMESASGTSCEASYDELTNATSENDHFVPWRKVIPNSIDMFDHAIDSEVSYPSIGSSAYTGWNTEPSCERRIITSGLTIANAPAHRKRYTSESYSDDSSPSHDSSRVQQREDLPPKRKLSNANSRDTSIANTPSEVAAEIFQEGSLQGESIEKEGCEGDIAYEMDFLEEESNSDGTSRYLLSDSHGQRSGVESDDKPSQPHSESMYDEEFTDKPNTSEECSWDGEDDGGFRFIGDDTPLAKKLKKEELSNCASSIDLSIDEAIPSEELEHSNSVCRSSADSIESDSKFSGIHLGRLGRSRIGSHLTTPGFNWSPPRHAHTQLEPLDAKACEEYILLNMQTQSTSEVNGLSRMEDRMQEESELHSTRLRRSAMGLERSKYTTEQNRQHAMKMKRNQQHKRYTHSNHSSKVLRPSVSECLIRELEEPRRPGCQSGPRCDQSMQSRLAKSLGMEQTTGRKGYGVGYLRRAHMDRLRTAGHWKNEYVRNLRPLRRYGSASGHSEGEDHWNSDESLDLD